MNFIEPGSSRLKSLEIFGAFALSFAAAILAFVMLGLIPMLIFTVGFFGGLFFWIIIPSSTTYDELKYPYMLTFVGFVFHKFEERKMDFFPELSKLTGVPVPDTSSPLVYLLYSVAAFWILIPFLIRREYEFGYYLAWTFFASMGIVELAHFIFPLLTEGPYRYFPGMMSVVFLAPMAWWGLWCLAKSRAGMVQAS